MGIEIMSFLIFTPAKQLTYFGGNFFVHQIMAWLAFYLFVSSNNATKQPDDTSDIGQLVTQNSCDVLQTTPPSQTCTIETTLFWLIQVVGVSISIFEVYYQCTFSISLHALYSRFSHRAEEYFSDPTLDMRNARTNTSKALRRIVLTNN